MSIVIALGILVTLATGFPVVLQMRKHPKGLFILFFAEMWERFSYYGMRAILIFYLTQHFLFDDKYSGGLFGAYTSLVYLLPLVGGLLADRWLGTRKAIAFGALLLVAGHLTMAIEGKPAEQILTYAGKTYEFKAEGRGDERTVELMVDGKGYAFGPKPTPGLLIDGAPAASPLPATLTEADYKLSEPEKVSGPNIFENLVGVFGGEVEETVSKQTLTYKGIDYVVTKREKGEESASTVLIAGTPYPIAPPKGGLVVNDLPATASLPVVLDDGDY
ncbi:MAG: hypothetical protein Q8L23_04200, partial [Caulobacter sp.]|nr:hypothetical protein [Caulobacter sp.]